MIVQKIAYKFNNGSQILREIVLTATLDFTLIATWESILIPGDQIEDIEEIMITLTDTTTLSQTLTFSTVFSNFTKLRKLVIMYTTPINLDINLSGSNTVRVLVLKSLNTDECKEEALKTELTDIDTWNSQGSWTPPEVVDKINAVVASLDAAAAAAAAFLLINPVQCSLTFDHHDNPEFIEYAQDAVRPDLYSDNYGYSNNKVFGTSLTDIIVEDVHLTITAEKSNGTTSNDIAKSASALHNVYLVRSDFISTTVFDSVPTLLNEQTNIIPDPTSSDSISIRVSDVKNWFE